MNKLNKIFLSIIIILIIALAISVYFCIQNLKSTLRSNEQIYLRQKAVTDAGFSFKMQEDGSFKLVEGDGMVEIKMQEDGSFKTVENIDI